MESPEDKKRSYPITLFPKALFVLFDRSLLLPEEPVEPSKPKKPIPPSEEEDSSLMGFIVVFYSIIITIGVLVILIGSGDPTFIFSMILLFVVGSLIQRAGSFFSKSPEYSWREELEQNYKIELAEYQKKLAIFKKKRTLYDMKLNLISNDYEAGKLMKIQFNRELKKIPDIKKVAEASPKGVSEASFKKVLDHHFPGKIFSNYTLDVEGCLYKPDFIYRDLKTGFTIDIEVDEPYEGKTLKPIHYIGSSDNARDYFFVSYNCLVIRFAEEQVVKNPKACCNLIAGVVNKFFKNKESFDENLALDRVKRWTEEDASIMSFSHSRLDYLPQMLANELGEEEILKRDLLEEKTREKTREKNSSSSTGVDIESNDEYLPF